MSNTLKHMIPTITLFLFCVTAGCRYYNPIGVNVKAREGDTACISCDFKNTDPYKGKLHGLVPPEGYHWVKTNKKDFHYVSKYCDPSRGHCDCDFGDKYNCQVRKQCCIWKLEKDKSYSKSTTPIPKQASGCQSNNDCKKSRICENGECVKPPESTIPQSSAPKSGFSGGDLPGGAPCTANIECKHMCVSGFCCDDGFEGTLNSTSNMNSDSIFQGTCKETYNYTPPPPEEVLEPAVSGCQYDTQCKGSRICHDGECTMPPEGE